MKWGHWYWGEDPKRVKHSLYVASFFFYSLKKAFMMILN
jgi:hypothetical protein